MSASFQCPQCGAPLDVPANPGATIRCPYCSNSVIVPRDLRDGDEPEWTELNLASLTGDPEKIQAMRNVMLEGNKIEAIKIFRQLYDVDLAQAKNMVEDLMDGKIVRMQRPGTISFSTSSVTFGESSGEQGARLQAALRSGNKIEAIKIYREMTNVGLKEAKDAVELMQATLGAPSRSSQPAIPPNPQSTRQVKRFAGCLVLFLLLTTLFAIGIVLFAVNQAGNVANNAIVAVSTEISLATPLPTQDPSFAPLALRIGKEGICGGCFEDLRSVAQAPDGTIYATDYEGGRIQVFDAQGNFVTQWTTQTQGYTTALAVGQDGSLFIAQSSHLLRYQPDGTFIEEWLAEGGDGFDDVWPLANGGMAAFRYTVKGDDLAVFDAQGNLDLYIPEAISGQTGDSELRGRVAADGLGNLYTLGTFNDLVLIYDAQGNYVNRFGGDGDQPGQFRAPEDVAIDQQGRIYVSDIKGIQVFDSTGRYLGLISDQGKTVFGLYINSQNQLLAAARTEILVFDLPD